MHLYHVSLIKHIRIPMFSYRPLDRSGFVCNNCFIGNCVRAGFDSKRLVRSQCLRWWTRTEKRCATSPSRVIESRENDATCLWLASEVGVATIRLRFGGGHRSRRRIGLQYRKSLANQLAPRYARNSAGTLALSLSLSFFPSPLLPLTLSLALNVIAIYLVPSLYIPESGR